MPYNSSKLFLGEETRSTCEFTIKIPTADKFDKMTHNQLDQMMEWFADQEKKLKFFKKVMRQEYYRRKREQKYEED